MADSVHSFNRRCQEEPKCCRQGPRVWLNCWLGSASHQPYVLVRCSKPGRRGPPCGCLVKHHQAHGECSCGPPWGLHQVSPRADRGWRMVDSRWIDISHIFDGFTSYKCERRRPSRKNGQYYFFSSWGEHTKYEVHFFTASPFCVLLFFETHLHMSDLLTWSQASPCWRTCASCPRTARRMLWSPSTRSSMASHPSGPHFTRM